MILTKGQVKDEEHLKLRCLVQAGAHINSFGLDVNLSLVRTAILENHIKVSGPFVETSVFSNV